jgi:hypothetical protein
LVYAGLYTCPACSEPAIFTKKNLTYKIKENSFVARIAALKLRSRQVAIVFGSTVHLHNTSKEEFLADKRWLLHELKHIEQFKRHGYFTFIFLYLAESIKHGYTNNKYEIEAREAEDELN